jgi:hypothetical protein
MTMGIGTRAPESDTFIGEFQNFSKFEFGRILLVCARPGDSQASRHLQPFEGCAATGFKTAVAAGRLLAGAPACLGMPVRHRS